MTTKPDNTESSDTCHGIDPILQALRMFEERKEDPDLRRRHFSIFQSWLVSDAYLLRLLMHLVTFTKPEITGLCQKHIVGLLVSRLTNSGGRKITSEAEAIQLTMESNQLSAFYLPSPTYPDGQCLRIISKSDDGANEIKDELSFRKKIIELGCIKIPRVLHKEEDTNFLYVAEELIRGVKYQQHRHRSLFISQGIPDLCALYEAAGIQYAALDTYYPLHLLDRIKKLLAGKEEHQEFLKTVVEAFRKNPDIPTSACHNALRPSNLCVCKGNLYFLNWNQVSEGPLFADLLTLPLTYEHGDDLIEYIAQTVKVRFPTPKQGYQLHFSVYIAQKIVENPSKMDHFLGQWNRYQQKFSDSE